MGTTTPKSPVFILTATVAAALLLSSACATSDDEPDGTTTTVTTSSVTLDQRAAPPDFEAADLGPADCAQCAQHIEVTADTNTTVLMKGDTFTIDVNVVNRSDSSDFLLDPVASPSDDGGDTFKVQESDCNSMQPLPAGNTASRSMTTLITETSPSCSVTRRVRC